ncbi:ArsR family transcriptional regulator [Intrasporangium oryzae NRRL B-24470]|uniref:ArsR family transcriptional regulator n=1 Tax=Intrasporangium oryzae NRRL B-24470 TaxID=1386089 RepID=W9GAF1_9MICO|nr:helix-turn-helix domain-containing protein [Intrasporangium oryzae]EWT01818.1 ArsR family transcriptional regulator [Intrasporangium oryzae NRRL B-24470]
MFIGERIQRETRDGEHVSPLESRTRSRVLHMVSTDGPVSAAELGRRLELTPAAVRRHLDALVEQGAVVEHEPTTARRGRGRPARAYVVSDAGHRALEADYDSLAVEVLRYLSAQAGPEAVGDFARDRIAAVEERYAARLAAVGTDPAARAEVLVAALSEDGFAATARPVGAGALSGVQLCQGHCPVQHVAAEFPAFCEAETDAFSRLLGVHVQRLATLAGGHHVCTTFIPTGGPARKTTSPDRVDPSGAATVPPVPHEPAQRHTSAAPTTNSPTHARNDHPKEGLPS